MSIRKVSYPVEEYPFGRTLKQHYNWRDRELSALHEWSDEEFPLLTGRVGDQSSPVHAHFYDLYEYDSDFLGIYERFVREVVYPEYGCSLVYQSKPTFRIHYPGNLAVGEWHTDSDYGHARTEINWWVPFTAACDNNTIWMESEENKGDYAPKNVDVGSALLFPGSVLKHGNKINDTGVSRVSMDFRVIPYEHYEPSDALSSGEGLTFKIGSYYSLLER